MLDEPLRFLFQSRNSFVREMSQHKILCAREGMQNFRVRSPLMKAHQLVV